MNTKELKELREEGALVINVLGREAYEKKHIADTINIPLDSEDFPKRVEEALGAKNRPVVVYCSSKDCNASPQAAERLRNEGFTSVHHFEGGVAAWEKEGLPLAGTATAA